MCSNCACVKCSCSLAVLLKIVKIDRFASWRRMTDLLDKSSLATVGHPLATDNAPSSCPKITKNTIIKHKALIKCLKICNVPATTQPAISQPVKSPVATRSLG